MDNKFVINTELNTDGVVTGAQEIKKQLEGAGQNGAEAGRKLGQNIEKGLNSALSGVKDSVNKALVIEDGGNAQAGIQSLIDKYIELKKEMDAIGAKRDEVLNQQSAIADNVSGDLDTRYYRELEEELDKLDAKYGIFGEKVETIGEALTNAGIDLETLGQEEAEVANETEKANAKVEEQTKKFANLGASAKKAEKHVDNVSNSFKKGLSKVLKYAFGISTLFVLFNKLRSAVKEGYGALMESDDDVKASINDLTGSLQQLKNQLASAFQPIISVIAPILSKFIQMLSDAMTKVGMFFAMLTGQGYINKAVKGTNDLAKGFGASADKAKELKNYTSSLDELNVLNPPDDSSGGGGGGAGNAFEKVDIDPEMATIADKIQKAFAKLLQKLKPITDKLKAIGDHLRDIFTDSNVVASAQGFVTKFITAIGQIGKSVMSIGETIAINILGGIEKYLGSNGDRIKKFISNMFNIEGNVIERWGNFAEAVANVFSAFQSEAGQGTTANIIGLIADSAMGATELVAKLGESLQKLTLQPFIDNAEAFKTTLEGMLEQTETITAGMKIAFDTLWDSFNSVYDEKIAPFFDDLTNGLSETVGMILDKYNQYVKPVMDELASALGELWSEHLAPLFQGVAEWFGSIIERFQLFYDMVKPAIDWILSIVVQYLLPLLIENIKRVVSVIGTIIDIVTLVIDIFKEWNEFITHVFKGDWSSAWDDILSIFEDVCLACQEYVEALRDGFANIFNDILDGVENMINNAIKGINKLIDALNDFGFDLPDVMGGGHVGFDIPTLKEVSLPRLATGAVIPPNREFMAVLGDQHNGTNVEAPLDTIKQALIEALDDSSFISYLASISDYTRVTSEKDMSVRIGDRDIARANIRGQKQMGRTLITSV